MNLFITGATGKVGSRFVSRMILRGHQIKLLVRNADKAKSFIQQGAEIIEGDLLQPEVWGGALRGTDVVVHLAAQFRGVDEETARISNIDASIALAEAALRAEVPRFVFCSTGMVYGSGKRSRPSREGDVVNPIMPYPRTKNAAEDALLKLHREQGLGLRILRLGFVYGDNDPHIIEFLPNIQNWNPAKRFHMVHHADVSQALMLAASTPGIDGRIYNVADDAPISIAELLYLHNKEVPSLEIQQDSDPFDMVLDTTRIRDELNYRPLYPSFYSSRDAGTL